mmetsp:Transcript_19856/g.53141  ORF Transcript_19856/g.53141 Transcript_19856/m.53141 type:complete len:423 (-) Transcript_19856:32-1300(-)
MWRSRDFSWLAMWSGTATDMVSLFAASYLLVTACVLWRRSIRTTGRCKPLIKHVTAIAAVDVCAALWTYVPSTRHGFILAADPYWCKDFVMVRWFLFNLSAFLVSSLTVGALCAVQRSTRSVDLIRYALFLAVPLAAFATIPAAVSHYTHAGVFCQIGKVPNTILAAVITLNFIFTVVAHIYGTREASKTLPGSVLRRSMRIIFRYHLAYWLSFGLFIMINVLDEIWSYRSTTVGIVVVSLAWRLLLMNGFFNFVALRFHVNEVAFRPERRVQSSVAFSLSVQVREVDSIDYNTWDTDCENQIQIIRSDNLELWDQMGILEAYIVEEETHAQQLLQASEREVLARMDSPVRTPFERRDPFFSAQSKRAKVARRSSWHSTATSTAPRNTSPAASHSRRRHRAESLPQRNSLDDGSFWHVVGRS